MELQAKKDRFSIRKLTIGAASVLLGFSFMGLNAQSAKAETVNPVKQDQETLNAQSDSENKVALCQILLIESK